MPTETQHPTPLDTRVASAPPNLPTAPADSPLRGTVLKYEDPLEPVAEDDWEALDGDGTNDHAGRG